MSHRHFPADKAVLTHGPSANEIKYNQLWMCPGLVLCKDHILGIKYLDSNRSRDGWNRMLRIGLNVITGSFRFSLIMMGIFSLWMRGCG
jgi:hypothetical protein